MLISWRVPISEPETLSHLFFVNKKTAMITAGCGYVLLVCFCFFPVEWLWRMRFNDVKVRLDHSKDHPEVVRRSSSIFGGELRKKTHKKSNETC